MKHIYSILCEKSSVDKNTNIISILNVLEEIIVFSERRDNNINSISIEFELVSFWMRETDKENNMNILVELFDPNNKTISNFLNKVIIPENKEKVRTILKIKGFKFTKPGYYYFKVKVGDDKKLVAEIPLKIKIENPSVQK